jgi:hypothetical protein
MLFPTFSFDPLCGAFVQTSRQAFSAYLTLFNLLDPFRLAQASSRLQRNVLAVMLP